MNLLAYVHLRNIYRSTGAGRVARQIIEHLAVHDGMNLHILADKGDHARIVHKVGLPWTNFKYHFMEHETSLQQARWLVSKSPEAERYWSDAQVVYCTGESFVPTRHARSVVTVHDAAFFEKGAHQTGWSLWRQRAKWKFLYRVLSSKVDIFHTVSQFSAERLAYFFPKIRSRLRVVPNAVPPRFFQPVSAVGQDYLQQLNLHGRRFILLQRGLHYRKNAELVLQAWPVLRQRFTDLKLVVTSHCDPYYIEQAQKIGDSVVLTGFVDDEALCSLYHAAQVMWFPSLYEGFGIPMIEAMACGTPVVASNTSSLPEVAGEAAILVAPTAVNAHVEAISSLLEDPGLHGSFSRLGQARAQQFTWQNSANLLCQQFEALL